MADEVVCLSVPARFFGIGQFYDDFSQTSDDVVRSLLRRHWKRAARTVAEMLRSQDGSSQPDVHACDSDR
jgi:predicted phosphoribosyltransferase